MKKSALKLYKELSPEQIEFVKTKKTDQSLRAKKWISFLKPPAQMDEVSDKARKKLLWGIVLSIVALIFSLLILAIPVLGIIVFVILLGLLAYFIVQRIKLKGIDLENNMRNFILPFLSILDQEIKPESKINLKFDVGNPITKEKISEKIPPKNRFLPRIKTTFYTNPWIEGEAIFADGTIVQWEQTDIIRKRVITKNSSSGKIKTKTKYKAKQNLKMKLLFPKNKYQQSGALQGIEFTESEEYHQFKIKQRNVGFEKSIDTDVDFYLSAIGKAYKCVKPL